jgi:hypothetical protein
MKDYVSFFLVLTAGMIFLVSCSSSSSRIPKNDEKVFYQYWHQGKAEISTYQLNQSFNGGQYNGTAMLIFGTEDFSRRKEVKLDNVKQHASDAIEVLKCILSKDFLSGVAENNMMTSVFSPLDFERYPHSLKAVTTTQDWNGQTYFQANWKEYRYDIHQFSYHESEGDSEVKLPNTWLEDEIWSRLRIAPDQLPVGQVKMLPSVSYLRLTHNPFKPYTAEASANLQDGNYVFHLRYPDLKRTLDITFEKDFPHKILAWSESYGQNEITTATLSKTILSAFWDHQQPEDGLLRDSLNLQR